jgi:hypothetical protein
LSVRDRDGANGACFHVLKHGRHLREIDLDVSAQERVHGFGIALEWHMHHVDSGYRLEHLGRKMR